MDLMILQVCMTGVETRTSAPLRMGRNEERISPTVGGFIPWVKVLAMLAAL